MNTSSKRIEIVIEKSDDGFIIYDDTKTFIDAVHIQDTDLVVQIVSSIVKGRIDGNEPAGLW